MSRRSELLTLEVWADMAPEHERFVPITYDGTVIYDRESGSQGFASPTNDGRDKFRKLFRLMSARAKALGYRKDVEA